MHPDSSEYLAVIVFHFRQFKQFSSVLQVRADQSRPLVERTGVGFDLLGDSQGIVYVQVNVQLSAPDGIKNVSNSPGVKTL